MYQAFQLAFTKNIDYLNLRAEAKTDSAFTGQIAMQTVVDVVDRTSQQETLPNGQKRKDTEGVFLIKDKAAVFVPVKTGIAGDKYFEVLTGLKPGDEVITGPFNSVRDLKEGDAVKPEEPKDRT